MVLGEEIANTWMKNNKQQIKGRVYRFDYVNKKVKIFLFDIAVQTSA